MSATTEGWAAIGDSHRTLAERAFSALRRGIVSGELAPGQRLRIEEIAAAMNVSHSPVREAIRQLESHGLVEHVPHRGSHVTGLSLDDLAQLYDARLHVEPEVIRRAAANFTSADEHKALDALRRHQEAGEQGLRVEAWQAHTDFHFALYEPCGSNWFIRLVIPLWESSQRYRLRFPYAEKRRREAAVEHRRMLEACVAHDGETAARRLRQHLRKSADLIAEHVPGEAVFAVES